MSSKTKIVVLRMKEIIYTAIFIGLAVLLILLFFFMFRPGKEKTANNPSDAPAASGEAQGSLRGLSAAAGGDESLYIPGLYSASLTLGSQNVNVEVAVDKTKITSVALVPLSDSVATMYPLMQPSMDSLAEQIVAAQSLEGIEYPAGSQYTSMALMNAVETALDKARK